MLRHTSPALLCLALSACASGTAERPTPAAGPPARVTETSTGYVVQTQAEATELRRLLEVPPQQVWGALPAVYEALGIPAEVRDEASHTFGTRQYTRSRIHGTRTTELVRCGVDGVAPPATGGHRVRLTALTRLQEAPGGKTLLNFEVSGTATSTGGTGTGTVPCFSTGKLEEQLSALVYAQAKR